MLYFKRPSVLSLYFLAFHGLGYRLASLIDDGLCLRVVFYLLNGKRTCEMGGISCSFPNWLSKGTIARATLLAVLVRSFQGLQGPELR